jgi:hypothetical protein
MWIELFPNSKLVPLRISDKVPACRQEDEDLLRYRSMRSMAGSIAEAIRRADAMARLELALSLAPVGVPVLAAASRHWM